MAKEVPSELTALQQPEQILGLVDNDGVRGLLGLLAMGQGLLKIPDVPAWVVAAAREMFKGISPLKKKSENYHLGYLLGLIQDETPQILKHEKRLARALAPDQLMALMPRVVNELGAGAPEFLEGWAEGIRSKGDFSPSNRCKVYAVMLVKWREVAKKRNVSEVQLWLEQHFPSNQVGSRERIAKLLQKIRFPLSDRGGRPRAKPRKA